MLRPVVNMYSPFVRTEGAIQEIHISRLQIQAMVYWRVTMIFASWAHRSPGLAQLPELTEYITLIMVAALQPIAERLLIGQVVPLLTVPVRLQPVL